MRVSEHSMRGKFRAGNMILPEANVKGTFALYLHSAALRRHNIVLKFLLSAGQGMIRDYYAHARLRALYARKISRGQSNPAGG